jgi:hypothetical protein
MTEPLTTAGAIAPGPSSETSRSTRTLLTLGLVAGPLFTLVALVQVLTRDGFDLGQHRSACSAWVTWAGSRSPTSSSPAC